jgi:hypothetical protein
MLNICETVKSLCSFRVRICVCIAARICATESELFPRRPKSENIYSSISKRFGPLKVSHRTST